MSRKSSLKSSTKRTQKRVNFETSPPHRNVTEKKEYEGVILVPELNNLWESNNYKDFKSIVIDKLEEEFIEKNTFEIKSKKELDELKNNNTDKFEEYIKNLNMYKQNLNEFIKLNYERKKNDLKSISKTKEALKATHYYKIKKIDEIPLRSKKRNTTIKAVPILEVKDKDKPDSQDKIYLRRSSPVPKEINHLIANEKKKSSSNANSKKGLFSIFSSMFSRKGKTVGGKRIRNNITKKRNLHI